MSRFWIFAAVGVTALSVGGCASSPASPVPRQAPRAARASTDASTGVAAAPAEVSRPDAAPEAPGVRPRVEIDRAAEAAAREDVRAARRVLDALRRRRGSRVDSERARASLELECAVGALATTLCEGFALAQVRALEGLPGALDDVEEAAAAIEPGAYRRCLREGGEEGACEIIDGQAHSALGEAELALERLRTQADVRGMAATCAPSDADLALP